MPDAVGGGIGGTPPPPPPLPLSRTIDYVRQYVLPAAYALLPPSMRSDEATAALLTIGLQESGFRARVQIPVAHAHGFWQFERNGGCAEVLTHPACKGHLASVLAVLQYPPLTTSVIRTPSQATATLHDAIIDNDVLAAVCARLLLRTLPEALPPLTSDPDVGWQQYIRAWKPGRPHRSTWDGYTAQARALI